MAHNNTGRGHRSSAQIGLTALTTAGLLAGGSSVAHAGIVLTNANLTTGLAATTAATDGSDVFFNFNTGQVQKTAFTGYQYRLNSTTAGTNIATNGTTTSFLTYCTDPDKLASGTLITDTDLTSDTNDGYGNGVGALARAATGAGGNWTANSSGYLGIRLGTAGNYNYGWADLNINSDYTVTLNRFAYQTTPNQAITAGAVAVVPEANPLELLLLGAAGLGAYRLLQKKREMVEVSA